MKDEILVKYFDSQREPVPYPNVGKCWIDSNNFILEMYISDVYIKKFLIINL